MWLELVLGTKEAARVVFFFPIFLVFGFVLFFEKKRYDLIYGFKRLLCLQGNRKSEVEGERPMKRLL